MATFSREKAIIEQVYLRRIVPGGEYYEREPYDLVTYDDNSGTYLEPICALGYGAEAKTWNDMKTFGEVARFRILDSPPFNEVQQIR